MLKTRSIPSYDYDEGLAEESWHIFLYKASTGSVKASDTFNHANMAYMAALTGNWDAPAELPLDDYYVLVREKFPKTCPFGAIQQFHDTALKNDWMPTRFTVREQPANNSAVYAALWGREPVDQSELMNDAMLNCLAHWSADHYIECGNDRSLGFNSCKIVSAMLYASATWPA